MKFVELTEEQAEALEERLEEYDQMHMPPAIEGTVQLGIEEDGRLIAGLDACITTFRILYVSTVFVEEAYRRKGYGRHLVNAMEARARELGVNTIRLDTFDFQGKEFYEAMGYTLAGSYQNDEDGYAEYFFVKRLH